MGLRSRAGKTATELVAASKGLRCSKFRGFVCDTCLKLVLKEVTKQDLNDDKWCIDVQEYLLKGALNETFVGHCCEWLQLKKSAAKATEHAGLERRYDGHLVIPEYGLLLDSPLNGDVDMHAFGNGDPQLPGAWHGLVNEAILRYKLMF